MEWDLPTEYDECSLSSCSRREEGGENVDHETVGGREDLTNILVDDGVENDRSIAVFSAAILICCTMARAFSMLSMYGRVNLLNVMFSNCAKRLCRGFPL